VFQCGNSDDACMLVCSLVFPVTSRKNRRTFELRILLRKSEKIT